MNKFMHKGGSLLPFVNPEKPLREIQRKFAQMLFSLAFPKLPTTYSHFLLLLISKILNFQLANSNSMLISSTL